MSGVHRLGVWLPSTGQVLRDISIEFSGVTTVVGRSGTGASLLLEAVAGRLPADARLTGTVDVPPDRIRVAPGTLPDRRVSELLGPAADQTLLTALGVDPTSRRPVSELTPSQRHGLAVAATLSHPGDLVVLDQPLGRLAAEHRGPVVAAIRRRAGDGMAVLWAEHHLEDALDASDQVVELVAGRALVAPTHSWSSRTVAIPPHHAAALVIGIPRAQWAHAEMLSGHPRLREAMPQRRPRSTNTQLVLVEATRSTVSVDLGLGPTETVGVVARHQDRERAVAVGRRLAAIANGTSVLPRGLRLPAHAPVGSVVERWARDHGVGVDALLSHCLVPVNPRRTTDQLSTGEQAALRWAMTVVDSRPTVLVDPEVGLDATSRREMARALHQVERCTVVVSQDPEFVVRACDVVVVLDTDDDGRPDDHAGTPTRMAPRMPVPPVLTRAGARVMRVSDLTGAEADR